MEKKDIIICLKKIRKNEKNIKKVIVGLKNMLHKCKHVSKSMVNNITKALCMTK